jgi:hypothetical protein
MSAVRNFHLSLKKPKKWEKMDSISLMRMTMNFFYGKEE